MVHEEGRNLLKISQTVDLITTLIKRNCGVFERRCRFIIWFDLRPWCQVLSHCLTKPLTSVGIMAIIRLKCLTAHDVTYIFRPTSFVFLELRLMTESKTDKLKEFDEKLKQAKKPKEVKEKSQEHKAMSNAYGYAVELLAGFVIGAIMGWSLDKWLETKPLFMIIFIFLGAGAGIFNVIKSSKRDFEDYQRAEKLAADERKQDKD